MHKIPPEKLKSNLHNKKTAFKIPKFYKSEQILDFWTLLTILCLGIPYSSAFVAQN